MSEVATAVVEKAPNSAAFAPNGHTPKAAIIRLDRLSKHYTEAGQTQLVLDELNQEFYEGEFVCLLGKSGSGKSTLLNLISGIDAPSNGDVIIYDGARDVRITALSEQQRTLFRRNHIGIVFQFFNLIPTLTVLENVTLPLELAGKEDRDHAVALLERVGLGNRLQTYPDKLSGGEQQRVAIARALAHDPLLVLADEPTGNLDEDTGDTVLTLLLELTRDAGKTLFMATHAPEVARQADRVLHLVHGKLNGALSRNQDKTMQNNHYSLKTYLRLAWRHARRRPLQSLFFVLGVAIGVAMIVAIDLANGSAERAFALGTETVTGKATHQILGGPSGLDEQIYGRLRRELGYRDSAPVVESYVTASELDAQPMRLLGIDPFAEAPFRSYLGIGPQATGTADYLPPLLVQPNTVLLSAVVAERYGLTVGDSIHIRVGTQSHTLTIVGLLQPSDDLSRRALDGLLLTDIATAQELLDRVGRLDRIDLLIPPGAAGTAALASIAAILPPSARIETTAARSGTVSEMTAAFSLNLTALSLLALVVGMFLIYNTVTFSVVQRRPVLGTLRALGMTRREIYGLILLEAGVLGALGTALGLGLGIFLGRGAVQLVTQTVNDLFFVVAVREVAIPIFTLVKGSVIGVLAALFGAAIPALEAMSVAPAGALKRSDIEDRARTALPWVSAGALLLLAIGVALLLPEFNLYIAFAGLFAVILGGALLAPVLTLWFMVGVQRVEGKQLGVISRMAPRTIVRSLSRTGVAVAALMVAVSVIIGVGIMIGSFRSTVEAWLEDVLQADIFISVPALGSNQANAALEPAVVDRLATIPGIAQTATNRTIEGVAYLAEPPTTTGETATGAVVADGTPVSIIALSEDLAGAERNYTAAIGDWQETWAAVEEGAVLINEPMANRYKLHVGDELALQTDRGVQRFPIVGIAVNFDVRPNVFFHDPVYRHYWDDNALSAIAVFVAPGVDVEEKVAELRAAFAGEEELLIRSNRGTRQNALDVFDRTFAITVALQLLATLVAFIGILSTLMSLQLERSREIGVLRATGMTRQQLWRLSLLETGLIGSSAGLIAMPMGLALAIILIYIINLRSFGWTLQMQLEPQYFGQAFFVALGAALLAGLYPAWRMGQMEPAEAVRSE